MTDALDNELTRLREGLLRMGSHAVEMLHVAVQAFVDRDAGPIRRVHQLEDEVDRLQVEIDNEVVRIVETFHPEGARLRGVLVGGRVSTEIERIGDQAVNLCEGVQLLVTQPTPSRPIDLPRMADVAGRMVDRSLEAYEHSDTEIARSVIRSDGEVDALHDRVFRDLLGSTVEEPALVTRSVALMITSMAIERTADLATNIAEEVIYMVEGRDVRHGESA